MQAETYIPDENLSPRFRDFVEDDIPEIVELGASFFEESEFGEFSEFSPENFRLTLQEAVHSPGMDGCIFECNGEIKGFLFYQLDMGYTVKPIALMWLFYVVPEFRPTPVGRQLLSIVEGHAKGRGATVFYGGVMAGIPSVRRTMKNMLMKAGYNEMFWGRKIFEETSDV